MKQKKLLSITNDKMKIFEANSPLLSYRKNINSQNGEDGILEEIFMRLNINNGWFCEFGAWDGIHLSNTFFLACKGWHGVYIEGDKDKYKDLIRTCSKFPDDRLYPINAFVHASDREYTIDYLLSNTPIPIEFDILSIDIDSSDYQVWESINKYRPKVVIIEINSSIEPPKVMIHGEGITGSSFQAMVNLAKKKGYTTVCHTGNVIAVRDDLVEQLGLPEDIIKNPESLFMTNWVSVNFHDLSE